jgi:hypothetical protein
MFGVYFQDVDQASKQKDRGNSLLVDHCPLFVVFVAISLMKRNFNVITRDLVLRVFRQSGIKKSYLHSCKFSDEKKSHISPLITVK